MGSIVMCNNKVRTFKENGMKSRKFWSVGRGSIPSKSSNELVTNTLLHFRSYIVIHIYIHLRFHIITEHCSYVSHSDIFFLIPWQVLNLYVKFSVQSLSYPERVTGKFCTFGLCEFYFSVAANVLPKHFSNSELPFRD